MFFLSTRPVRLLGEEGALLETDGGAEKGRPLLLFPTCSGPCSSLIASGSNDCALDKLE